MSWHSVGTVMRGVDLSVTLAKGGFFSCRWNRKGDRAQPDDLLEDPFGLELGLWEWSEDGPYASEVKGPNGKRGVPLLNFAGWFALTTGVTLAYKRLQITGIALRHLLSRPPRHAGPCHQRSPR